MMDKELRPITDQDKAYIKALVERGVPRMAVYNRMREAGIDVKEHHVEEPESLDLSDSRTASHSLRLKPEVTEAIRQVCQSLGYEYYTKNGVMGVLPPLINAIVTGKVRLVTDDPPPPPELTPARYSTMSGDCVDA